jgi:hypothetical protein
MFTDVQKGCPHFKGRNINQHEAPDCCLLHVGFLLGSFFELEDGDDVSPKRWLTFNGPYGTLYPRRQNSSMFEMNKEKYFTKLRFS